MAQKEVRHFSRQYGAQEMKIETGRVAGLADGEVVLQYGDTVLLATAVVGKEPRDGIDYFPLMVDYEERLYAAGKISGSRWMKREGRPSENAVLTSRLIDRPLRPLFPKTYRNDVQVIVTVLSFDGENDPDVLSIVAASAALVQTKAPFMGPVSAARVGMINGEFVLNPTRSQMEQSTMDLVVAGMPDRVMMLEAGMQEVPEETVEKAIKFAQDNFQTAIDLQNEVAKAIRPAVSEEPVVNLLDQIMDTLKPETNELFDGLAANTDKADRTAKLDAATKELLAKYEGQFKQSELKIAIETLFEKAIRRAILERDIRPDGRAIDELRPLGIEVDILPRVHGSALFSRGETQVLSIVTLGSPGEEQMIETMEEETTKRFMHHYNFPPFSVGEAKPVRAPSRREIGHGALAERALVPIIPDKEVFPYTVRVVSEVLSSNGSTSQASVCGSMLALMAAGVPVKNVVSGIAMGLVTDRELSTEIGKPSTIKGFKVLTDLQGLEDFSGDMDFKVAGTEKGVTAIQLDIKIDGLTSEIVHDTFEKARKARLFIREKMLEVIPEARAELSPYAPRISSIKIAVEKIGELIGPGGKTINKIIADCGGKEVLTIDIEEDGTVTVSSHDPEMSEKAIGMIQAITQDLEVGQILMGEVKAIQKDRTSGKEIGAIVQLTPRQDGMVHISQISKDRIEKVSDVLHVGDKIPVLVKEIDRDRGRISLSYRDAMEKQEQKVSEEN